MRKIAIAAMGLALAACSHIPLVSKAPPVVGIVEYDTGLTRFSTVTGIYHQDMCSKENPDAHVHLADKEVKAIFAGARKSGFFVAQADLTTRWSTVAVDKPAHCATYRLHIESGGLSNDVRWDCGWNGSNAPPPQVAPVVAEVQKALRSKKEVQAMPWSSCQVK
jgi:hypothetical protein